MSTPETRSIENALRRFFARMYGKEYRQKRILSRERLGARKPFSSFFGCFFPDLQYSEKRIGAYRASRDFE